MSRTNEGKVRAAIETDTDLNITAFIRTAGVVTDWLASQDEDGLLSTDALTEIETYLACHFYSLRDPQYSSKSTAGAGGSFHGQTSMYFSGTLSGQTALLLDVTGNLARREKEARQGYKDKIQFEWLGMSEEQADEYYGADS